MQSQAAPQAQQQQQQQDKRNLIEVTQLIDLTDKPIGLTHDEISWARVKSTSSNCICCCCNDSVTLVTTNDSYILDHVPLDSIRFAQTNASLQQMALSNHRRLVVVDLVDNNGLMQQQQQQQQIQSNPQTRHQPQRSATKSEVKVVNLSASGLTMDDVVFWRWLDDNTLAILSWQALYTCQVNQAQINHHAMTALSGRSHYLGMERVFDVHSSLLNSCQIFEVQRDQTGNLYAISGLYAKGSLPDFRSPSDPTYNGVGPTNKRQQEAENGDSVPVDWHRSNVVPPTIPATTTAGNLRSRLLRPSFGSVPSRLSQMVTNNLGANHSLDDTVQLDLSFDARRAQQECNQVDDKGIAGLVQIHSKARNRSQLINAHAVTFTSNVSRQREQPSDGADCKTSVSPTILIAATKTPKQIKVHFIEMTTDENANYSTGAHSASSCIKLKGPNNHSDFPTWIVCSLVECANNTQLHVAMMTTKFGRLIVCSVSHSTVLFTTSITQGVISSTILESRTKGLMVVCRNGQVLLVRLNTDRLLKLIEETKTLRHISSSHNLLGYKRDMNNNVNTRNNHTACTNNTNLSSVRLNGDDSDQPNASLDLGLDILISTKL